jgi:hypothetical protein
MANKVKVLVFPCGAENATEIHQALRYSVHVDLLGASSVDDYGSFRFEQYVGDVPNIRDAAFDTAFGQLIKLHEIEVVFATHDSVLEHLAPRAAGMNFYLVNGDPHATQVARRKSLTYGLFADCAWCPTTYAQAELVDDWPIVVKPDCGQGGRSVTVVASSAELSGVRVDDPVLVEYLPGEELTVDCFSDRRHRLAWVGARTRNRVRAGITMRSELLQPTSDIVGIATTINERLSLRGPWFFQIKRARNGSWKLLEVSCRVGGAMVAQRAQGINLPLLAVQDYLGRDLIMLPNRWVSLIERCIATRARLDFEYDTVVIDLDDTLVIDGQANPVALAFLYQSIVDGKKLVLLTRHAFDVAETLHRARIAVDLFDHVVHISATDPKSDHVTPTSIFIDNHFPERAAVAERLDIPVLDVDALEFFIR